MGMSYDHNILAKYKIGDIVKFYNNENVVGHITGLTTNAVLEVIFIIKTADEKTCYMHPANVEKISDNPITRYPF